MNWFKSLANGSHPQRRIRSQFPLTRTEHFEPRLCLGRLVTMQSDPAPAVPAEVAGVQSPSSNFAASDTAGSGSSGFGVHGRGLTAHNEQSVTIADSQTTQTSPTSQQSALNIQVAQSVNSQLVSAFDDSASNGSANTAANTAPSTAPIQKNNTEMSASTTGSSAGTIAPPTGSKSMPPAATPAPKTPGSVESRIAASGDNVMGAPASKLSSDQLAKLGLQYDADGNAIGISSKVGTFDLWWKDASGPVTVKYDFRGQGGYQNQMTDAQKAIAVNVLNDWSAATGGKLVFVQDTSAPAAEIINIGIGDLQAVGYTGGSSVISLGGGQVTVTPDGKFTDAGVAWLDASQNWSMSSNTPNPASTYDFYTIVAHEVGHAIGFGESVPSVNPDIMTDPYQGPMNAAALAHAVQNDGMYIQAGTGAPTTNFPLMAENATDSTPTLTSDDVKQLLQRAAASSATQDAIIAVVDRNGRILGVRVEAGVLAKSPDTATLVYMIDGAVAEARTAAMFSNADPVTGTLAPLTSRTVGEISQSTITQREVQSTPDINIGNPAAQAASTLYGPGLVAPIGLGGHFPPGIDFTSPVDLFDIEHTNRDTEPANQATTERFNIDLGNVPGGAGGPNVLL
ncbi:MAG TPA: matrixin family metalloprotease, partial [Planctomycetaceae bacterium]